MQVGVEKTVDRRPTAGPWTTVQVQDGGAIGTSDLRNGENMAVPDIEFDRLVIGEIQDASTTRCWPKSMAKAFRDDVHRPMRATASRPTMDIERPSEGSVRKREVA